MSFARTAGRRFAATLILAAVSAIGALPAGAAGGPSPAGAARGPDPVVFVHGFGENGGRTFFTSAFTAAGYARDDLFAFRYDAGRGDTPSNRVIAAQLHDYIDDVVLPSTGARSVDIVAHSMGSLPARACIAFERGCRRQVDDLVSLGGPNHGTVWAVGCGLIHPHDEACREMTPGSSLLRDLNRGDETPGRVTYTTVRSTGDGQIRPVGSVRLQGATNHMVPGLDHAELTTADEVFDLVLAAVR